MALREERQRRAQPLTNFVHSVVNTYYGYGGEILVTIIHEYAQKCKVAHSGF